MVYEPSWPFGHHYYLVKGTLLKFPNTHGAFKSAFKEPAIIFCGKNGRALPYAVYLRSMIDHPSLRLGESVNFMRLLGDNPLNTVILTEPEYTTEEVRRHDLYMNRATLKRTQTLSVFSDFKMRVAVIPVDTRLTTTVMCRSGVFIISSPLRT